MDFRILVLSLLFVITPALADTNEALDELVSLVYQYPSQANQQLDSLKKQSLADKQLLRLQLLECGVLLQTGEHQAAIVLAQKAQRQAKQLKLEQALPYFQICEADGYGDEDDLKKSFPLLDSAIDDAKNRNQPQALVGALRLKGAFEFSIGNYTSAIESLRLAIDVYPDIKNQRENWTWPPLAYIYADMAGVMHATGDLSQADYYLNLALKLPDTKGKIQQSLAVMSARVALDSGDKNKSVEMLQKAINLLPEIGSSIEHALSQAQIGSIELSLGNITEAEASVTSATEIFKKNNDLLQLLRVNRLMAEIRLAQKNPKAALEYLQSSADISAQLAQFDDLSRAYTLQAKIHAQNKDYSDAYQAMQLAVEANQKAQEKLNNTQFMQYKAKLELQEQQQTQAQQQIREATLNQQQQLDRIYALVIFLLLVIAGMALWVFSKSRGWTLVTNLAQSNDEQLAESMLANAKKTGQPLSILLVDIRHVRQIDLPALQDEIEKKLREQDKLIQHSAEELLVILPYTSNAGSERVVEQLDPVLQHWHTSKSHVGIASLKQPDTLQTLLKRASISQLSRSRNEESFQSPAK
ncbi:hypothetical protein KDN34_01165 [Shewanella yunxiaonensis]|uniref:GGDEF domain-containing protein n=1 Tax=Shewanella yunxiaonensis TaxID=2829809 RepID=A0ABX7YUY2_9GAMM|nr:hypothetical protein [Shewanella yunxiaonensis]QUN06121.1 hypothetical protein KDN34_01165 [Shewanella yunxiaonensis]